jgi:hypothetical protein
VLVWVRSRKAAYTEGLNWEGMNNRARGLGWLQEAQDSEQEGRGAASGGARRLA